MGFFDAGLKEGNRFFTMLTAQAARTVQGVEALERALDRIDAAAVAELRTLAQESGEQRRVLVDELQRTFVTPIDREDLYNLSSSYDKTVAYALTTLEEMQLLGVAADEPIRRMVVLVREQVRELELATRRLAGNPRVACDHANHVLDREREVEQVYRAAIRDLFARASDVPSLPEILYRREVYRHISNMADRAVTAANVLGMVVMKIA